MTHVDLYLHLNNLFGQDFSPGNGGEAGVSEELVLTNAQFHQTRKG